jgi:futalosine hydrolase
MARTVLFCVATEPEGARLRAGLGTIGRVEASLIVTGIGPVNAAVALTRAMVQSRADAVLVCGVGGAYPGAGLAVGEVVCAASEQYGDLGAASADGFLDMEALGFPVVPGDPPVFNRLPLACTPLPQRVPFVTCSTCTGDDATARAIAARTGGAVESMEGAAFVHAALLHGVPVAEIRGISNAAGDRDRASWRLRDAADAAQDAALAWLREGAPC